MNIDDLIRVLQNAKNEGVTNMCVFSSQNDCGHPLTNAVVVPHSNTSSLIIFYDNSKEINTTSI